MKIAILHQFKDFKSTVFFKLLAQELSGTIQLSSPKNADLIIYGPFGRNLKTIGPFVKRRASVGPIKIPGRRFQPINIFHTIENERHNNLYDFSVSYDYTDNPQKNFRFPYWMESIDWSHEGVIRPKPLRLSRYFRVEELQKPLTDNFLSRKWRCAAFFGQIREPRAQLLTALKKVLPVDGFGKGFDNSIKNSQSSGIDKDIVLRQYAFNLCPENSLYPGYYTEKILESFGSGSIPLTWADSNIKSDFNPNSFINLHNYAGECYSKIGEVLASSDALAKIANEPLLQFTPTIEGLRHFIRNIISTAKAF